MKNVTDMNAVELVNTLIEIETKYKNMLVDLKSKIKGNTIKFLKHTDRQKCKIKISVSPAIVSEITEMFESSKVENNEDETFVIGTVWLHKAEETAEKIKKMVGEI